LHRAVFRAIAISNFLELQVRTVGLKKKQKPILWKIVWTGTLKEDVSGNGRMITHKEERMPADNGMENKTTTDSLWSAVRPSDHQPYAVKQPSITTHKDHYK